MQKVDQIWISKINESDLQEAINYATISLPWTFDRMRYGIAKQKGMNRRLINIMKGVLNQTLLERILTEKGYDCKKDWTNYRQSDIFDFSLNNKSYDVKTGHVYSEYSNRSGREEFSPALIIKYKDYPGPIWYKFFPKAVTLSQITYKDHKDGYIFGIAETWEDVTKITPKVDDDGFWCSVPYGKPSNFFHNTILIRLREEKDKGFNIVLKWRVKQQRLISNPKLKLIVTLFGEWKGKKQIEKIPIKYGQKTITKNQYSSLSCIRLDHPALLNEYDKIVIGVKNNMKEKVPKTTNPLINLNDEDFEWIIDFESFVNLKFPNDYKVYWIGYTTPQDLFKDFTKYRCYFIPLPGRVENQEGRLTPNFKEKLENMDKRKQKYEKEGIDVCAPTFKKLISGQKFKGGLLIAQQGRFNTLGAASYVYPPQPGAFPESAIYVLPGDLYRMKDL